VSDVSEAASFAANKKRSFVTENGAMMGSPREPVCFKLGRSILLPHPTAIIDRKKVPCDFDKQIFFDVQEKEREWGLYRAGSERFRR
jgi:hypothetical protein